MATRPWNIPKGAIRIPLPDTSQETEYTCGASCLLSVCLYYGVGPEEEEEVVKDSRMSEDGANPDDLCRAAKKYGLTMDETYPMSVDELLKTVGQGTPVICMLQAWPLKKKYKSFKRVWREGHWVVAIGWDEDGIYFEDPSIDGARGFLTYEEMCDRWHDWGKDYEKIHQYGLAVWRRGKKPKGRHIPKAERIR